ncbi:H-NS histone family protein [Acinetobacter rathckeae]|uniref:H-NS histone family protein n=1 Tax=Acinetobacter rathckeae TaxID=2605272 RepID=UPI0018A306ED|nr:H-NS histone family protein [Acinetobacter rathckeae]MBF7688352.1 H-NS histone family protein [Acinetobacter rathckeae]MBF7695129.1 H-NS histone family protein [Acinetobacter rathckeae]
MQDINDMNVEQLESLKKKADLLIESKKEQSIADAYEEVLAIAASVGLTIEQLLDYGLQKRKIGVRKPVAPRYRNPENPTETWTGRGKKPRWLVAQLAQGAVLTDFLI